MAKTRKAGKKGAGAGTATALTIPDLRKRFDSIEEFARRNPDNIKGFSSLWKKMFGKSVSDQAARDYLAFVRESKSSTGSQKGGALGAPLDYTLRPGTETPYGNFPPYVVSGFQYQGQDSQLLTKIPSLTPPAGLGTNAFPTAIQSGGLRKRSTRKGNALNSRLNVTRKQKGGALPPLSTAVAEMMTRPAQMGSPPTAIQDLQMLGKGVNTLSSPRPEVPGPFVSGLQSGPIFSENIIQTV
jgi:hypothetical protein